MQQATPVPALTTTGRHCFAPACPARSADPADRPNPIGRSSVSLRMKAATAATAAIASVTAAIATARRRRRCTCSAHRRAGVVRAAHRPHPGQPSPVPPTSPSRTATRSTSRSASPPRDTPSPRPNRSPSRSGSATREHDLRRSPRPARPRGASRPDRRPLRSPRPHRPLPNGRTVYPGPVVFHCPEETGFQLAPHSSVQATASWNQTADVGTGTAGAEPQQAPPAPTGSRWTEPSPSRSP